MHTFNVDVLANTGGNNHIVRASNVMDDTIVVLMPERTAPHVNRTVPGCNNHTAHPCPLGGFGCHVVFKDYVGKYMHTDVSALTPKGFAILITGVYQCTSALHAGAPRRVAPRGVADLLILTCAQH